MNKGGFVRQATGWRERVPGAHWLRADLHVHTVDDARGGHISLPTDLTGELSDPDVIRAYARSFLEGAIAAKVQVLGITPHAVRVSDDLSAVWTIVDVWNDEADLRGRPFRESIFAVFPGLEPSFDTGAKGLHLQFLFDPEIGRSRFLRAADLLWQSIDPWDGRHGLRVSSLDANAALQHVRQFHAREGGTEWGFLVLAPHVDRQNGLFEAKKGALQSLLDHAGIAALELADSCLPQEMIDKKGEWFEDGLQRFRHALYHASDAYKIRPEDPKPRFPIGHRYTWLKLAEPRTESLRQAFVASESRLRIAYRRDEANNFVERADAPDAANTRRAWLRAVTVKGGASFFGGREGDGTVRSTRFEFSPDLTCVIGGSMTGKSTLLDGLRRHLGAEMPSDARLAEQVQRRADTKFLAGGAEITLDWSTQELPTFFTQNELQRYAENQDGVEALLTRLVPGLTSSLVEKKKQGEELEASIATGLGWLDNIESKISTAAQELKGAEDAQQSLTALAASGYPEWEAATQIEGRWKACHEDARGLLAQAEALKQRGAEAATAPDTVAEPGVPTLQELRTLADAAAEGAAAAALAYATRAEQAYGAAQSETRKRRTALEKALVERGLDGRELDKLRQLTERAKYRGSFAEALKRLQDDWAKGHARFRERLVQREQVKAGYRAAMRELAESVERDFEGSIRVGTQVDGRNAALERFLVNLGQQGVTRWCNTRKAEAGLPPPRVLASALDKGELDKVGMSDLVQDRFREAMSTASKRRALDALASSDAYDIHYRLDDGTYRRLGELSGGQRVGVILTLLLESDDTGPLIIDQPEDELDNRFLSHTLLPALRRLKGRRQIIVATHNANLVVNGDADMVILLEADANHGRVAVSGAIDDENVRSAIVETVDGGREAFRLRRMKYGF